MLLTELNSGALAQRVEGGAALAGSTVELTENETHERAGLADRAGLDDGGADLRHAAHHGVLAENGDEAVGCIDSILQRDDGGARPNDRANGGAGRLHVPKLDAEQYDVDWADAGGIVGGLGGREMHIPARAEHAETARAHCRQMRAARHKGHIGTGLRQHRSERSANPASADHCYPHGHHPRLFGCGKPDPNSAIAYGPSATSVDLPSVRLASRAPL